MLRSVCLIAAALLVGGCASANLPYEPQQQPPDTKIYADYYRLAEQLRVELDTGGIRLEYANIITPDGQVIRPTMVEHTVLLYGYRQPRFGVGVGSGFGYGHGVGGAVGVSTSTYGYTAPGNTFLWFDADEIGPPPWELRVKLVGQPEVVIMLPEREGA